MVGTPRAQPCPSPTSEDSDAVDISEYLTRAGRHSVPQQRDGYELDSNFNTGSDDDDERQGDGAGNASRDGATIAALLDELESIQTTYGRITQAFGNSEKENAVLVATLQQLMAERNELLQRIARRSVSRDRQVATFEANAQTDADVLRRRVADLEDENRRLVQRLERRSPSVDRPLDATSPPCKPPDGAMERSGQSAGSAEGPSTTIASIAVSPENTTTTMQTQQLAQQPLHPTPPGAIQGQGRGTSAVVAEQMEAHSELQEMLFRAHEEKLWMIIRTRGRELEHVCKLLASTERRNAELVAVLADLCNNVGEQKSLDARQQTRQEAAPVPTGAAAVGQKQRARGGGVVPAGSSRRGSVVQSPAATGQRAIGAASNGPTQIRRGSIVPPPPQRLPTASASATQLPLAPKGLLAAQPHVSQRPVSPATQANRRRSIVAADAVGDMLLVEKPRWS